MPTKIRDLDSFLQRLYQCGPQPTRFRTFSNHCHQTCTISQWKWIINGDQQFPIGNHEFHGFPNCCRLQLNAWLCSASLFVGKEPTAIYGIFVRITALCVFFLCLCWTYTGRLCVNPFVVGVVCRVTKSCWRWLAPQHLQTRR